MATEFARMNQLIGTTADWGANPSLVLGSGEIGLEILVDGKIAGKVGDGVNTYGTLPYTIGASVDLTTAQDVAGQKTFTDTVFIQNQTTITKKGQIFADDLSGVHGLVFDSREISSNVYIQARDALGDPQTLACGLDGKLYWNNTAIADDSGLAGVTWGGFDADGVKNRGAGFTVSLQGTGEYLLTFDDPSVDGPSQSLVASGNTSANIELTVTTQPLGTTQATIWVSGAAGVAVNEAVTFIRNYIPEPN